MEGEKQLLLHLAALKRLDDTEGALSLLAEKGQLMREPEARLREEAGLLEAAERWGEAAERHASLLRDHSADDFDALRGYIR